MEKKKTTEEEYDLSYYLGGNEEELPGRSSQQHTKMTRSGKPSEDVEPLQNTEVSRCTELSHETEQARRTTITYPIYLGRFASGAGDSHG